jgi:hypothetical protein
MIRMLLLVLAAAAEEPFRSPEELQAWLTYYYLKPRPELTIPSLAFMERELEKAKGRSLADEVTRGGMRTFYAKILEQNPSIVREIEPALSGWSTGQQAFVREALRRCGTEVCLRILNVPSPPLGQAAQPDPGTLDDSWAAFFATGDEKYVREVIEVLPWSEVRGDVNRLLTGGAARWSLASNAYQHGRVLAICEKVSSEAAGPSKRMLDEIITQAKAERAKNPPPEPK